jgi:hypothetical protein
MDVVDAKSGIFVIAQVQLMSIEPEQYAYYFSPALPTGLQAQRSCPTLCRAGSRTNVVGSEPDPALRSPRYALEDGPRRA